ncbi:hypothetical protein MY3957_002615 [Beauveria namnaoensis]
MSRPLLPKLGPGAPPPPPPPLPPKKTTRIVGTRKPVSVACERCRIRKLRCTGARPTCEHCSVQGVECLYRTPLATAREIAARQQYRGLQENYEGLQRSQANLAAIMGALQSHDQTQAGVIFQMLREGVATEDIARRITTGLALMDMRLTTETKLRFEFPYRAQMPLEILSSNVPYLQSPIYELYKTPEKMAVWDQNKPQYMKPYRAADMADSRLKSVLPTQWTTVSRDDMLMRSLLQDFFLYEYPWYPFFQIDHFLDDMLHGAEEHCSSLLVNVILSLACGCHLSLQNRAEYWNPNCLAYKFLAEARRLWDLERELGPRLTTIQSALLFNIIYNMQSMDKLGMTFTLQAISMAQSLGMLSTLCTSRPIKMRASLAFTAWSLFNWTTLQQYHFMKAPIIESPPKFPLPDPLEEASWYGEIMLLYPPNNQFCPMHFRHLQRARSELSLILLEITTTLWGDSIELRDQYLYNFIDEKSKQLDEWAKSLPAALAPVEIVYPSHFKLHLLFFNVIMNLQGLVEAKVDETPTSQVYVNRSRRVANHARLCFETLMRLYYLRHGYEMSDTYITHALATLGFATLNQLMQPSADGMVATERTDEIRSTVFLMAKGLADQGRNYFIPYTIFELIKHSLTADDTRTLQRFLSPPISFGETASGRLRADHIQAQYPVNIVDMTRHPEQKRLGNMIRDFSALAVELQSPQAAEGANTVQSESS